MNYGHSGIYPD
ncbi:unnamed protein product, partial [Rotaria sordida]